MESHHENIVLLGIVSRNGLTLRTESLNRKWKNSFSKVVFELVLNVSNDCLEIRANRKTVSVSL